MATDSSSGCPGPEGSSGNVARVNAARRIRFDPVNSLATVSTGTTLAPRSVRNWRKASSSRRYAPCEAR